MKQLFKIILITIFVLDANISRAETLFDSLKYFNISKSRYADMFDANILDSIMVYFI